MNRRLLFLGTSLSFIAMLFALAVLFLTDKTSENIVSYSNFQVAFQINLFHAGLLFILAIVKRKYNDKNIVIVGNIFAFSTLLLAIPAYIGMFLPIGETLFYLVGIFGGIGLIIGWIVFSKSFYDIYSVKRV